MGSEKADTAKVIKLAVKHGWIHDRDSGGHNQTHLYCGHEDRAKRCKLTVYSTPKRGQPKILRQRLAKCPHGYAVHR